MRRLLSRKAMPGDRSSPSSVSSPKEGTDSSFSLGREMPLGIALVLGSRRAFFLAMFDPASVD